MRIVKDEPLRSKGSCIILHFFFIFFAMIFVAPAARPRCFATNVPALQENQPFFILDTIPCFSISFSPEFQEMFFFVQDVSASS